MTDATPLRKARLHKAIQHARAAYAAMGGVALSNLDPHDTKAMRRYLERHAGRMPEAQKHLDIARACYVAATTEPIR